MFGNRPPNAAELLQALGGVGGLLDAMRKQSDAARKAQEQARSRSAHLEALKREQAQAIKNAETQWYLKYIHGGNARFFNSIVITDAEWTPVCPT
jgi:hypothetical protein